MIILRRNEIGRDPLGIVLVFRVESDKANLPTSDEMLSRTNDGGRNLQAKRSVRCVGDTPRDAFRN